MQLLSIWMHCQIFFQWNTNLECWFCCLMKIGRRGKSILVRPISVVAKRVYWVKSNIEDFWKKDCYNFLQTFLIAKSISLKMYKCLSSEMGITREFTWILLIEPPSKEQQCWFLCTMSWKLQKIKVSVHYNQSQKKHEQASFTMSWRFTNWNQKLCEAS